MNQKIYNRNIITAAVMVVVLFVSIAISIYISINLDLNVYDNEIRVLASDQKNEIENGIFKKGRFPYIVFDLEGKVLYSEEPFEYKEGEFVNPQEMLQFDQSFAHNYKNKLKESFLLQDKGKTTGFTVFLVPKNLVIKDSAEERTLKIFIPLIIGIVITIGLLYVRMIYCNIRILKPLKEISDSAKAIIKGNYDLEVIRTYEKEIGENEVGELSYSFELMRDELKEKQIREEVLKKSQQELISCISHDLKTPLSTIKAYSEGLRDGIANTDQKRKDYISIIINKTDLLIGMINDLLEFSNSQLKQLEINRQEIYFLDYFIPVMNELEIFVKQNRIEFETRVNTQDMLVCIDTKRITEVLYNLVENSMKYIEDKKGKICIQAEREGKYILIKVIDNGIGISADDIPYVFDKFYRAEKSRSSKIPGSGLGLSICKYIVNEHGGEIYCRSRYKEGCEIGFTIS